MSNRYLREIADHLVVVSILCFQKSADGSVPRLIGVVASHGEKGLWLHKDEGFAARVAPGALLPTLTCNCSWRAHPVSGEAVLELATRGIRKAKVVGQGDLRQVE